MPLQIGVPAGAKIVPGSATAKAIENGTLVITEQPNKRQKTASSKKCDRSIEENPRARGSRFLNAVVSASKKRDSRTADEPPRSRKRKRTPKEKDFVATTERTIGTLFECMDNILDREQEGAKGALEKEVNSNVSAIVRTAYRQFDEYIKTLKDE